MKQPILILLLAIANCCYAQDKETRAQAYYMSAEDAYNASNYQKAYDKLVATENILGESNAKIEYLKVKSLMELKKYSEAKTELNKYFDMATNAKGTEKYLEMMLLYGKLDDILADAAADAKAKVIAMKDAQNKFRSLAAEIDDIFIEAIDKQIDPKYLKVDSTTVRGGRLIIYYSGKSKEDYLLGKYGLTNYVDLNRLEEISVSRNRYTTFKNLMIKYEGQTESVCLLPFTDKKYNNLLAQKIKELATLVKAN